MYDKADQSSNLPPIRKQSAKGSRPGRSANSQNRAPTKPSPKISGVREEPSFNSGEIKMLESEMKKLAERVGKAEYDREMMQFEYNIMKKDYDFVVQERDQAHKQIDQMQQQDGNLQEKIREVGIVKHEMGILQKREQEYKNNYENEVRERSKETAELNCK